jgi:hypothetical protein
VASRLDGHANDFLIAHYGAHALASVVALGSGAAGAALPEMLSTWADEGLRFGERYVAHAAGHREAANAHVQTEGLGADERRDVAAGR